MSTDVFDSYLLQAPLHGDLHQNRKWRLLHLDHRSLDTSARSSARQSQPSAPNIKIITISYKSSHSQYNIFAYQSCSRK